MGNSNSANKTAAAAAIKRRRRQLHAARRDHLLSRGNGVAAAVLKTKTNAASASRPDSGAKIYELGFDDAGNPVVRLARPVSDLNVRSEATQSCTFAANTQEDAQNIAAAIIKRHWVTLFFEGQLGEEGADQLKQAREADYQAWTVPCALLMTVSFSMLFVLDSDIADATPDGYPNERSVRRVLLCVYIGAMMMSAMQSYGVVWHFIAYYIASLSVPAKHYGEYESVQASGTLESMVNAKFRKNAPVNAMLLNGVNKTGLFNSGSGGATYSVMWLVIGIVIGVGLKYGWEVCVAPGIVGLIWMWKLLIVFNQDRKLTGKIFRDIIMPPSNEDFGTPVPTANAIHGIAIEISQML